jgi:hypothetical protein
MSCAQKDALLREYRDTVAGYIRIVKQLKTRTSALSEVDFATLSAEAKDCLMKSKAAQRLLQRHISEHHC